MKSNRSHAMRCAARLLGLCEKTIRRFWGNFTAADWQPLAPKPVQGPEEPEEPKTATAFSVSADARRLGLQVRVREALVVCARGGTAKEYRDAMQRAGLAGVAIGTKYNHHSSMELVEHLAVVCCRELLGQKLGEPLPGLGIRPM